MSNQRNLSDNPLVVLVGFLASLIAIVAFATGQQTFSDLFPTALPTPAAQTSGPIDSPSPTQQPRTPEAPTPTPAAPPTVPSISSRATIEILQVEHDVVENDQRGMRIHTRFTIYDRKDVKCLVTAYFHIVGDKDHIKNPDKSDVRVSQDITPESDKAVFDDVHLFMPYKNIPLPAGKHQLMFHVSLLDQAQASEFGLSKDVLFDLEK